MAKALQCDRCGRFFTPKDDFTYIFWSDSIEGRVADDDRHEGDLCFKCAKELKDWFKNEDKEVQNV